MSTWLKLTLMMTNIERKQNVLLSVLIDVKLQKSIKKIIKTIFIHNFLTFYKRITAKKIPEKEHFIFKITIRLTSTDVSRLFLVIQMSVLISQTTTIINQIAAFLRSSKASTHAISVHIRYIPVLLHNQALQ